MANVRIAQMGQTAVNRPFFEVVTNSKRYVAAVNGKNQIEVVNPRFLQMLGVHSSVANQFQSVDATITQALGLVNNSTTNFDKRFPNVNLGTGLGFVSDFQPYQGWVGLAPTNSLSF